MLLPRWLDITRQRCDDEDVPRRVVYLVSGSSTPRNKHHSSHENSTYHCARFAKMFIEHFFGGEIQAEVVDSGDDILHYEHNVRFVLHTLRPLIEQERRRLVLIYGNQWHENLKLTLSLGSGAPARVAAINAGLRPFRPSWLHIWQPKRFWHEFPDLQPIGCQPSHCLPLCTLLLLVATSAFS